MRKSKIGFSSITQEATAIANNPNAKSFVEEADKPKPAPANTLANKQSHQKMLVLEGYLKDRNVNCQRPIQLYLLNEIASWISNNVNGGRGGQQLIINYLLKKGIESVETHFQKEGVIFDSLDI